MSRHTRTDLVIPRPDPDGDRRRALGQAGEALAVRHLVDDDGLEILATNWRVTKGEVRGELDVVAVDAATGSLVVCEVKTRRGTGFGGPLAAVTPRKQAKIRALTLAFLRQAGMRYRHIRFDVVAVLLPDGRAGTLDHLEGVF